MVTLLSAGCFLTVLWRGEGDEECWFLTHYVPLLLGRRGDKEYYHSMVIYRNLFLALLYRVHYISSVYTDTLQNSDATNTSIMLAHTGFLFIEDFWLEGREKWRA